MDVMVPTILGESPQTQLTVSYSCDQDIEMGQELNPGFVKSRPKVRWEANPAQYYTLLMFDPDAPSRDKPMFASVNHWLVVNIKGHDLSTGEIKADYIGAGPPRGTGLHRYVFLVFEQRDRMEFDEAPATSRSKRFNFSVDKFMKKYGFDRAYAGSYFRARWDPVVDDSHNCCFVLVVNCFLRLCCVVKPCATL